MLRRALRSLPQATLLLAALAFWLLPAGRAEASCGYYVVTAHPSEEMVASLSAMPAARHAVSACCPCRGSECRAGQSGPATDAPSAPAGNEQPALGLGRSMIMHACFVGRSPSADATPGSDPHVPAEDPPPED